MKTLKDIIPLAIVSVFLFSITGCDSRDIAPSPGFEEIAKVTPISSEKAMARIVPVKKTRKIFAKRSKKPAEEIRPAIIRSEVPEFDTTIFERSTVDCFVNLAKLTGGMAYFSDKASEIVEIVSEVLTTTTTIGSDVVILIDHTSSMWDDIDDVKSNSNMMIDILWKKYNVKLAVGIYGDKNVDGSEWYKCTKLSDNFYKSLKFISDINLCGGGDFPESVYDAIYKTANEINWSSQSKRVILVIGDAPSLEQPLSKHNQSDVINLCISKGIKANIYPIIVNNNSKEVPTFDSPIVSKSTRIN